MDNHRESKLKMQEADQLVQQVVNLANPSRPTNVQQTKAQQAQQIKFAIVNKNKFELERCIAAMEETTANAQRRLEELEPKSVQLVGLVKYIKEALTRESMGLQNHVNFEEERLAKAQKELAEITEQIVREKQEIQQSIENAKDQLFQMDLKINAIDGVPANKPAFTPEEEAAISQEENTVKILEEKLARLLEISDHNTEEFNEKHKVILSEIESVQAIINEVTAQNQAKQTTLAEENKKSVELEQKMRELEKKLATLRE